MGVSTTLCRSDYNPAEDKGVSEQFLALLQYVSPRLDKPDLIAIETASKGTQGDASFLCLPPRGRSLAVGNLGDSGHQPCSANANGHL